MKIPHLDSRYIPVGNLYPIEQDIIWWKENSDFTYPYILLNLDTVTRENLDKYEINDDVFLLTDSGGFQVIRGMGDYTWETSLLKQIELRATKIFSFDIPPVRRLNETQNIFVPYELQKTKEIIRENLVVALKQSAYLKEKYPESLNRLCYILQATSYELLEYNINLINELCGGIEGYRQYFPGGIAYSIKTEDILLYAMAAKHANDYFIKQGIYVHFLGMGSFNKMLVIIRNKISTFDSSNALRGAINWSSNNPLVPMESFISSISDYYFNKQFCLCPTCMKINYPQLMKDSPELIGRNLVKHNLWHSLMMNIFLDSLKLDKYSKIVKELFKPADNICAALDYIDDADKMGLSQAYKKYEPYLKKNKSKQQSLF